MGSKSAVSNRRSPVNRSLGGLGAVAAALLGLLPLVGACVSGTSLEVDAGSDLRVDKGTGSGGDRSTGVGGHVGVGGAMGVGGHGTGGVMGVGGATIGTGGTDGTGGESGVGGATVGTGGTNGTGGTMGTGGAGTGGTGTGGAGTGGAGTGGDTGGFGGDDGGAAGNDGGVGGAASGTGGAGTGGAAAPCDPQAPTGYVTNYVTNTDFEADGIGWTGLFGGTFVVSSTVAHCGTHSGEESARTQQYQGIRYDLSTSAQGNYSVSLWIRHDAPVSIQMGVQGVCNGNMYLNIAFQTVAPNTWLQAKGMLTVPGNCTSLWLQVVQNTAPTGAGLPNLFVDDVYVVQ